MQRHNPTYTHISDYIIALAVVGFALATHQWHDDRPSRTSDYVINSPLIQERSHGTNTLENCLPVDDYVKVPYRLAD